MLRRCYLLIAVLLMAFTSPAPLATGIGLSECAGDEGAEYYDCDEWFEDDWLCSDFNEENMGCISEAQCTCINDPGGPCAVLPPGCPSTCCQVADVPSACVEGNCPSGYWQHDCGYEAVEIGGDEQSLAGGALDRC